MEDFIVAMDQRAGGLLLAMLLLTYILHKVFSRPIPYLLYSDLNDLKISTGRSWLAQLPYYLYLLTLLCFSLAFIDLHLLTPRKVSDSKTTHLLPPAEGIAIYLVLDQSGSMSQTVTMQGGDAQTLSKMDLLKQVTKTFIQHQTSDLLGLVAFARVSRVLSPLTLDHQTLLEQLEQLDVIKNRNEDGTAMGYAIFKTAHLIAATRHYAQEIKGQDKHIYDIKNSIMIVVTDGLQDPNALDQGNRLRTLELNDAAEYAKSQGVRLYIINIDPRFSSEEFAPHRRLMEKVTQLTGGQFYLVDEAQDLQKIYTTIDQIEKGTVTSSDSKQALKPIYKRFSFYPFFILIGLMGLLGAFILDFLIIRKIP